MNFLLGVQGVIYEWPGWSFKDLIEVAAAIASVFLGFMAVVLTIRTLKLGQEQKRIAIEQTAISKRQGEIAETQHQIMQEQLARKAVMQFVLLLKKATEDSIQYEVSILNSGTRARQLHWNFLLPRGYQRWLSFSPEEKSHRIKQTQSTIEFVDHDHYRAYTRHPVYQGRRQLIGLLVVDRRNLDTKSLVVRWQATCNDGEFPEAGQWGSLDVMDLAAHKVAYGHAF